MRKPFVGIERDAAVEQERGMSLKIGASKEKDEERMKMFIE